MWPNLVGFRAGDCHVPGEMARPKTSIFRRLEGVRGDLSKSRFLDFSRFGGSGTDLISTADAKNRAPAAQNLEISLYTNLGAQGRRRAGRPYLGGI